MSHATFTSENCEVQAGFQFGFFSVVIGQCSGCAFMYKSVKTMSYADIAGLFGLQGGFM